uniref:Uncharacterized protein n=1 Tax=Octopus bimaculoides TaxID=37653 RepID=A0A0L8HEK9_OCTBM
MKIKRTDCELTTDAVNNTILYLFTKAKIQIEANIRIFFSHVNHHDLSLELISDSMYFARSHCTLFNYKEM